LELAETSGVGQRAVAGIFEVGQFALSAGTFEIVLEDEIFEVGLEAGSSVELAVAAKAAAVAVAVEVRAVAAVAHEVSAVEADLHRIAQPVGSVVHGQEK